MVPTAYLILPAVIILAVLEARAAEAVTEVAALIILKGEVRHGGRQAFSILLFEPRLNNRHLNGCLALRNTM